jgi:tRNA(Ile)-lysidine synthetase-like protein
LEIALLDVDVPALAAARGEGIEETARAVRYEFFARLMRERNIPLLVTAHHADDNLETVLFRLCRGSGTRGICGISPCRPFEGGYLVRPLLHVTRREIEAFCEARGLSFVTDASNSDTAYARNRIRAEVVPILESLFDSPQKRVADLTDDLREDERYLSEEARAFCARHIQNGVLPCEPLASLPLPIRNRVLRLWVEQTLGVEPERVHLSAIGDLLVASRNATGEVALPRDFVAVRWFGSLRILPREDKRQIGFSIPLTLGTHRLTGSGITIKVSQVVSTRKIHNLYTQTCIISRTVFDIIKNGAYWRPYVSGDRILQGGIHKRLRRCWNEAGVPTRLRGELPFLCDREGVLWAPYVGARDGVVADASGDAVEICVTAARDRTGSEDMPQ